ncbi:MAG: glucose-1-phosphate cytidylyltransferase [Bdellovibrionota bacterium]
MKAVILAGGFGTRLSEETQSIPKPMVRIGHYPIIWHIMKIYSHFGVNEFVVCLGYKGYVVKEYFANYYRHNSDLTVDTETGDIQVHRKIDNKWRITLVDTGEDTMTGGRLKRIGQYLNPSEDFFMTYGDGVADINIKELYDFHKKEGRLATVTSVKPPGRFGAIKIDSGRVDSFSEKPKGDGSYINGGFFVLSPEVLNYISDDKSVWEREPMENLAKNNQMSAYIHNGFWKPMDTLRDKHELEDAWSTQKAPWRVWV